MARFRATVRGDKSNSTEASRLGHRGLRTVAASWAGAIEVQLYIDDQGKDCARVSHIRHHGAGVERLIFDGPVGV